MPEILLRLHLFVHSKGHVTDAWWQRSMDTDHLPEVGDEIQLWGREDGPLALVRRRWWRPDGTPLIELASLIAGSRGNTQPPRLDERGRPEWVPWDPGKGAPAALLRAAGWGALADD